MTNTNYNIEVSIIKTLAINNGYSVNLIDKLLTRKSNNVLTSQLCKLKPIRPDDFVYKKNLNIMVLLVLRL